MTLQHHQASQPHYRNTPPRATATQAAPAGDLREALTLLGLITDGQQGWLEVCWIDGDPTKGMGGIFHSRWQYISNAQDIEAAARRCLELGATYGNVYVSSGLYTKRSPKRDAPMLDSRVIFLDDAPADPALPYTLFIQTSARSGHAYYATRERLTTAERVDLSRRAAAALKSDKSGADAQQIVRVPGTFNTKGGAHYRVHIASQTRVTYTADELRAAWPAVADKPAGAATIDDQAVAFWLGNIEQLVDSRSIPWRIKSEQARALWLRSWHDTSARRWALAKSLILHGYPDDQAAAILYHTTDDTASRKGSAWLADDIARCIDKGRQECAPSHGIVPVRPGVNYQAKLPAALPSHPPRRKGRPAQLTAATYLAWLELQSDGWPVVFITRREAAAQLGVSMQIIGRLERKLAESGHCHRDTDHHDSWVAFGPKTNDRGVIRNAPTAPDPAAPTIEVLSKPPEQPDTETALERENSNDIYGIKEHTAPIVPVCPAPALASASPAPPVAEQPSLPAAAVAAGACVPFTSEQDSPPVIEAEQEPREAEVWREIEAGRARLRMTAGVNQYSPPVSLPEGSKGETRERVAEKIGMSGSSYERPVQRNRPRMNEQAGAAAREAFDGVATMARLRAKWRQNGPQPTAVSLHKQAETPPPPAAPAALPPSPPVQPAQDDPRLVGVDWQAAARAWDRGRIEKFCEVHSLDREAMISHFIQAARAA